MTDDCNRLCADTEQHYEKTSLSCQILERTSLIYGIKILKKKWKPKTQRTALKYVFGVYIHIKQICKFVQKQLILL